MFFKVSLLLLAVLAAAPTGTHGKVKSVLLVSFDGFRRDYLTRGLTPTFEKLISQGVTAKRVYPSYPTYTQPCHYTMVTGRHPDHHGVVANTFFEQNLGRLGFFFEGFNRDAEFWTYNKTEPIWISAIKQGRKAGGFDWPGIGVFFPKGDGSFVRAEPARQVYDIRNRTVSWKEMVNRAIGHIAGQNIEFMALHHSEPDGTGHYIGPETDDMNKALIELDKDLQYLLDTIRTFKLQDKLNLIIVADHGMAHVDKTINVGVDYDIDQSHYYPWTWGGVMFMDITARGNADEIFEKLKKGSADFVTYRKEDVPARFIFGKNPRISNFVLMPRLGVQLRPGGDTPVLTDLLPKALDFFCGRNQNLSIGPIPLCKDFEIDNKTLSEILENYLNGSQSILIGNHGYDNEYPLMEPLFIAYGPAFKKGHVLDTIRQVDYYPLMTNLLEIVPQPHDGSFDNVKSALVEDSDSDAAITCQYPNWTALLLLTSFSIWIRKNM